MLKGMTQTCTIAKAIVIHLSRDLRVTRNYQADAITPSAIV
jgi:hypothetical protein